MKKLDLQQMELIYGWKFLGIDKHCSPCFMWTTSCLNTFYFAWMQIGDSWEKTEACVEQ
ncbi:MAG: hypothetical protein WC780_02925 [Lentimicrobiaceae bacterium]|jgi:hypothetical protein